MTSALSSAHIAKCICNAALSYRMSRSGLAFGNPAVVGELAGERRSLGRLQSGRAQSSVEQKVGQKSSGASVFLHLEAYHSATKEC